jgi:hypothetical protein
LEQYYHQKPEEAKKIAFIVEWTREFKERRGWIRLLWGQRGCVFMGRLVL